MFACVVFARSHVPRSHVPHSHTIPAVNEWRTKKRMWQRSHRNSVHTPPLRFCVSTLPIPSSTFHISTFHVRASHSCKTLEVRMRFSDAIRTCGAGEVCCQRGISGEDLKGQARLRRSHVHVRAFAPKPLRSPGNVSGMCIVSCRRRGAAAVPGRWWEASRVGRVLYSPSSFPMCRLRSGGNVSGACTVAYR